jgi:hypothetical protein
MGSHFVRIFSLARLIIIDGLRRYALIGLIVFALAGEAGGLLFFDFIPRDIGRASNDFLFSISWITGFIFLLFHAVQAAAWDDGRRVIHTFLARPISRAEYVLGVFTGLALLLLFLNLILGGIGWIILNSIKNSVGPIYFQHLSLTFFILTTLGLYCIELMILAVILFFSGAVRGSFPVLLLTLSYYFSCYGLPVVREAVGDQTVEASNQGLTILLKWMTAIFPDFSRLDFKTLVTVVDNPRPIMEFIPIFGLSTIYVVILLWLASLLYQRRDLK